MNVPQLHAVAEFTEKVQEAMVECGVMFTDKVFLTVSSGTAEPDPWFTIERIGGEDWHLSAREV